MSHTGPQIPNDLNGHDSLAVIRAIHEGAKEVDEIAAERQASESVLREQYQDALERGEVYALCDWAPLRTDTRVSRDFKRYPTLGEVVFESFDLHDGPDFDDVTAILLRVAAGEDCQEEARKVLARGRDAWVRSQS
jgi:hypothetical protein